MKDENKKIMVTEDQPNNQRNEDIAPLKTVTLKM